MEYMEKGDMQQFLKSKENKSLIRFFLFLFQDETQGKEEEEEREREGMGKHIDGRQKRKERQR
jgi:hypothetical protein